MTMAQNNRTKGKLPDPVEIRETFITDTSRMKPRVQHNGGPLHIDQVGIRPDLITPAQNRKLQVRPPLRFAGLCCTLTEPCIPAVCRQRLAVVLPSRTVSYSLRERGPCSRIPPVTDLRREM